MTIKLDPVTDGEWQDAVDAAHGMLLLDSARQYGRVQGGPQVNVARCEEILERGKNRSKGGLGRSIVPSPGIAARLAKELVA